MTRSTLIRTVALISLLFGCTTRASAQDDDAVLKLAEPDFTIVALPTGLRVPKFKGAFRVTHRFARPLNAGDFGDLVSDLFGIDSGARIGLEYRFGLIRGGQIGFHRTSDRTTEFFAHYDVISQGNRSLLGVTALASIDGANNFRDSYSPAIGAVVSRLVGTRAAFYVIPMWVNNTNVLPSQVVHVHDSDIVHVHEGDTVVVGVGGRVRLRPTVYLTAEATPRVAGHKPGVDQGSFAIEKRAGRHMFQLNFSNGFGTTVSQLARGGPPANDWYLGFNISRKFFF